MSSLVHFNQSSYSESHSFYFALVFHFESIRSALCVVRLRLPCERTVCVCVCHHCYFVFIFPLINFISFQWKMSFSLCFIDELFGCEWVAKIHQENTIGELARTVVFVLRAHMSIGNMCHTQWEWQERKWMQSRNGSSPLNRYFSVLFLIL